MIIHMLSGLLCVETYFTVYDLGGTFWLVSEGVSVVPYSLLLGAVLDSAAL